LKGHHCVARDWGTRGDLDSDSDSDGWGSLPVVGGGGGGGASVSVHDPLESTQARRSHLPSFSFACARVARTRNLPQYTIVQPIVAMTVSRGSDSNKERML
jgi:hypothetical protein